MEIQYKPGMSSCNKTLVAFLNSSLCCLKFGSCMKKPENPSEHRGTRKRMKRKGKKKREKEEKKKRKKNMKREKIIQHHIGEEFKKGCLDYTNS